MTKFNRKDIVILPWILSQIRQHKLTKECKYKVWIFRGYAMLHNYYVMYVAAILYIKVYQSCQNNKVIFQLLLLQMLNVHKIKKPQTKWKWKSKLHYCLLSSKHIPVTAHFSLKVYSKVWHYSLKQVRFISHKINTSILHDVTFHSNHSKTLFIDSQAGHDWTILGICLKIFEKYLWFLIIIDI